jgi:hypothetical protein
VFSGMLGVTVFGLILTPLFYVLVRKISLRACTKGVILNPTPGLLDHRSLSDETG